MLIVHVFSSIKLDILKRYKIFNNSQTMLVFCCGSFDITDMRTEAYRWKIFGLNLTLYLCYDVVSENALTLLGHFGKIYVGLIFIS